MRQFHGKLSIFLHVRHCEVFLVVGGLLDTKLGVSDRSIPAMTMGISYSASRNLRRCFEDSTEWNLSRGWIGISSRSWGVE